MTNNVGNISFALFDICFIYATYCMHMLMRYPDHFPIVNWIVCVLLLRLNDSLYISQKSIISHFENNFLPVRLVFYRIEDLFQNFIKPKHFFSFMHHAFDVAYKNS